jgi:hypothetical protein
MRKTSLPKTISTCAISENKRNLSRLVNDANDENDYLGCQCLHNFYALKINAYNLHRLPMVNCLYRLHHLLTENHLLKVPKEVFCQ